MKGFPCVCPEPVLVIYRFSSIKEIDHRQVGAFFFSPSPAGCCQLQWVNRRAYVVQRLCALAIRPPELDLCVCERERKHEFSNLRSPFDPSLSWQMLERFIRKWRTHMPKQNAAAFRYLLRAGGNVHNRNARTTFLI
jgi:hypothetical protein